MESADDALVSTLVDGRYRVLRRIGEGGMGSVYEVSHERIGRRFALKTLHAELAKNSEMLARFHQEARAAGAIGNEHIIEVSDMGQLDGGEPFIVMELLEGNDLGEMLEATGPLSIASVVHIATQASEGLQAAHAAGIIHRDLKPENIFLVSDRKQADFVKLLDFGISKFREVADGLDGSPMTRTGITLGTPYYMAPEQAMGAKDVDGRVDVYALGVVLFQLLTGRLPFEPPSLPELLIEIMQARPPSIVEVRPDVPPALEAVIMRTLAKHPDARFSSVTELAQALAPFAGLNGKPVVVARTASVERTYTPQFLDSRVSGAAPPPAGGQIWKLGIAAAIVGLIGVTAIAAVAFVAGVALRDEDTVPVAPVSGPAVPERGVSEPALVSTAEPPVSELDVVADSSSIPSGVEPSAEATVEEPASTSTEEPGVRPPARDAPPVPRRAREPAEPAPSIRTPRVEPTPPRPAEAPSRTIAASNERRAEVEVVLTCGPETRTTRVGPGATVTIRAPVADCRVSCSGLGGPRCPLALRSVQNRLVIR